MATYYLDPVGGNNANAGTSFALRKQTIAGFSSLAAGDVVRVIASPDPTSLGNATWTNNSNTVTLAGALTADITQATAAWTASTNVTTTTSTDRKLGATSSSIAVAAAFTTGKAAYLNLGGVKDLSGYQQVSFWIKMTAGTMTNDGDITLRLCSDTTGDTTVNTISIPRIRASNAWQVVTVDLGTNLGSTINSIALYVAVDNAAQTFLINNVLACKASSSADSLTLSSIIGKNTGNESWFSLQSISGTTLTLDVNISYSLSTAATTVGYYGTTETVTTYKRENLNYPSSIQASSQVDSTYGSVSSSGSAGSPITFSGGWNRTDMSTQTGESYLSGVNGLGYGIYINAKNYITFEKINPSRFGYGFATNSTCVGIIITCRDLIFNRFQGLQNTGTAAGSATNASTFTVTNVVQNAIGINLAFSLFNNSYTVTNLCMNQSFGINITPQSETALITSFGSTSSNLTFTVTNSLNNGSGTSVTNQLNNAALNISALSNSVFNLTDINNTRGGAIIIGYGNSALVGGCSGNKINISGTISSAQTAAGGIIIDGVNNNIFDLTGMTCDMSSSYTVKATNSGSNTFINGSWTAAGANGPFTLADGAQLICINSSVTASSPLAVAGYPQNGLFLQNYNGSATDHRIYYTANFGNILTDTSIRHTASGISWKMTSGGTPGTRLSPTSDAPLSLSVAKIAVNSGTLVTASVWVYRTNTSLTTNFVCPAGQLSGVAPSPVSASAAINTWEQLTMTFTPSMAGVVELFVQCYGAAASVYVDDFSVSQA